MTSTWVPDSSANACTSCKRIFSGVRKHHCRACGFIFCDACSTKRLPLPHANISYDHGVFSKMKLLATTNLREPMAIVRVCEACWDSCMTPKEISPPTGGETFEGPPLPPNPGPLPLFPLRNSMNRKRELAHTLVTLQTHHLPVGVEVGFVVVERPTPGGLGDRIGIQQYDFIYGCNGELFTKDTTQILNAKSFVNTQASITFLVYNFQFKTYRKLICFRKTGGVGGEAVGFGVPLCKLPIPPAAAAPPKDVTTAAQNVYLKTWRKLPGGFYMAADAIPANSPHTPQTNDLYVQVFRERYGSMYSNEQYHPLYDYTRLIEPLYVKVWLHLPGGFLSYTNDYEALPMERIRVAPPSPTQY